MADTSDVILVFDMGLTNCKSVAFSPEGRVLASATIPYRTYHVPGGGVEQDPADWWAAMRQGSAQMWHSDPTLAQRVAGIGVTGHMHALVCLDSRGRPLTRSFVLGDRRGSAQAAAIASEIGMEAVYKTTGTRMDASMPAAKIRWLRETAPGALRAAALLTSCKDYLRGLMTGDHYTDPIDACATSLYDLTSAGWSSDMLAASGVRAELLPDIRPSAEVAGSLLADPASELGLRAGIPVVVGGGDDVEVLGCGMVKSGLAVEHLGTTGSILACADRPVYDPQMSLELYPHAEPGLWILGGSITAAGSALEWAANVLHTGGLDSALAHLNLDGSTPQKDTGDPAEESERALVLFLPHLLGERCPAWEPGARGAWIGMSASTTRDEMMAAALRGVTYALKTVLERIGVLVGMQREIAVAKRDHDPLAWLRLRASAYARPLNVSATSDPSALGAMLLTAAGLGMYPSLREAVEKVAATDSVIHPEPSEVDAHRHAYSLYLRASEALLPMWKAMERARVEREIPTKRGPEAAPAT